MDEIIEYLVDLLNIKASSRITILDMEDELKTIADFNDYRVYCKSNFNHINLDFMNGFQKFTRLTDMYRAKVVRESSPDRVQKAINFCMALSEKVKGVTYAVEEDGLDFQNFKQPGGDKSYFTDYEQKELEKIGGLHRCCKLRKSQSGEDALYETLFRNAIGVIEAGLKQPQIENTAKDITALAEMATKRF